MSGGRKPLAAIYVRISNDREGRALGVERQEEDCRALAARSGWTVIEEVFGDNDIPASTRSRKYRPRYEAMLAEAAAGRIDVITAYSTGRLTRRPREFERLIELAESGLRIATVKTGDLDLNTARGRRRARDDAARDAEYAEEVGELVQRAKDQAKAVGKFIGGPRAFGWRPAYTEPDPVEAPMVAAAIRDVLDGRSLAGIAARWQEATGGAPAKRPRGGEKDAELVRVAWRPNAVRAVLRNPRHAGFTRHGVPAPHPGIVDEATWRGVLAVLDDPARRVPGRTVPRHLLTGLAVCGRCGAPVHAGTSGATRWRLYRCSATAHLARSAAPIDEYVARVLLRYLAREQVRPRPPGEDTAALARAAAGLRAQLDQLAALLSEHVLTEAGVRAESARLRGELEAVEARMAAAVTHSVLAGLPSDLDALTEVWRAHADDVEWRRAVLEASGLRVVLDPPGRGFKISALTIAATVRIESPTVT